MLRDALPVNFGAFALGGASVRSWPAILRDHRQLPGIGIQWQQFGGEILGISEYSVPIPAGQVSSERLARKISFLRTGIYEAAVGDLTQPARCGH